MKNYGITKLIRIQALGMMNVCTKFPSIQFLLVFWEVIKSRQQVNQQFSERYIRVQR